MNQRERDRWKEREIDRESERARERKSYINICVQLLSHFTCTEFYSRFMYYDIVCYFMCCFCNKSSNYIKY